MKRFLLAGVTALAIGAGVMPAHAEMPVIDTASLGELYKQGQQGVQQLQTLQQQLQQVQAVYSAISHVTDLSSAMSALNMRGIQNPLPVNASAVQSLLNGSGNVQGMLGNIGSLFNSNWNSNHVYTPTDGSAEATLLKNNANSIAGIQGLAGALYQSMSDRLTAMSGLETKLSTATDLKDVASIDAEIGKQRADIQAQGVQAQTLAMLQVAAYQSQQQQQDEKFHKDLDTAIGELP